MKKILKLGLGVWVCLALTFGAAAVSRDTSVEQYRAIPERNAFGLKPPEQPVVEPPPPKPVRKIILTGITTLGCCKKALLKAEPLNGPEHQGEKEESLILTEGQREGEIEIVQIDEHTGRVTVNNSGTVMTLSFEKDAQKMGGPAPTSPPGNPVPAVAGVTPIPSATPTATSRPVRRRPGWPMNSGAAPVPPPIPAPENATGAPTAAGNNTSGQPLPADLTPEERAIILELQKQVPASNTSEAAIPGDTTVPANQGASVDSGAGRQ